MISDREIIFMVREAATEPLPIAVMTVREMRQFAELVAKDCIRIVRTSIDPIQDIKDRYERPAH